MSGKPEKNHDFLIYMLCSAVVVAAATFFFHVSDMKETTTTIILDKNVNTTAEPSEPSTEVTTVRNTSTAATVAAPTTDAEATEFVYLDLNAASHSDLKKLKGIGDVLADAIIRYRQDHGGFRNIEEIMEVSGISEGIFSDIAGHIYVVDPVYTTEENPEVNEPAPELPEEHTPTLEELAPININTADITELMLLPHVDEETAQLIIKLREDINGFGNTYELAYVEKLSKNQVNDILPYVTVE